VRDPTPSRRIDGARRFAHPKSDNGAYLWDGERGWAMAWDGDGEMHWFGGTREWTEDDKREWKAERERERAKEAQKHRRAETQAAELLRDCELRPHGYLKLKGFPEHKALCTSDDALVVPMRDMQTNALRGAQLIRWQPDDRKWEKKMLPGMKAKGAVLRLGPPKPRETILCEGYATGLSIEAAANQQRLNAAILVCFSDSNMVHVAPMVRKPAFVFADNDKSEAGERAAKATGLPYCMADVVGWDANDLHYERGLMAVCSQLLEVRVEVPQ
jgi:phage/plasmid primase-like uncharacterized protein